jgi:hypothetical protein
MPMSRASSMPDKISTRTPARRSTSSMNSAALDASRTEAVAVASTRSAPRASAMERKRFIVSHARSMAAGAR